jgi:hypothetical protein
MIPFSSRPTRSRLLGPLLGIALAMLVGLVGLRVARAPALWPPLLGLAGIFVVVPVAAWIASRLEVQPNGLLVVAGPWPGRRQEVDLSDLVAVAAAQRVTTSDRGLRVENELHLADGSGRRVRLDPGRWAAADELLAAVRQGVETRGLAVENGELFGLGPVPEAPPPAPAWDDDPPPSLDLHPAPGLRLALGFGGAVFLVVGLAAALIGIPIGLLVESSPVFLLPFAVIGLLFALLGLLGLAWSLLGRLRLAPDGTLVVRGPPTFVTRRAALGELSAATSRLNGWFSINRGPPVPRVAVRLADRSGRTVQVEPGAWQQPEVLAPALARWAATSGVDLDRATQAYLLHGIPPVVGRTVSS